MARFSVGRALHRQKALLQKGLDASFNREADHNLGVIFIDSDEAYAADHKEMGNR